MGGHPPRAEKARCDAALLWTEYRAQHPTGYAYGQFCERYRRWARTLKPSMRQVHRAGEKLFVDFSGKRPHSAALSPSPQGTSISCFSGTGGANFPVGDNDLFFGVQGPPGQFFTITVQGGTLDFPIASTLTAQG